MNAEKENLKNTKPCPYDPNINCVQYPDDDCNCNPCDDCECKIYNEKNLNSTKIRKDDKIITKDDDLYLSCPRCGNIIYESKIYPEVKVGKKIKCQNCGISFIATPKIANDKDTLYEYQII